MPPGAETHVEHVDVADEVPLGLAVDLVVAKTRGVVGAVGCKRRED